MSNLTVSFPNYVHFTEFLAAAMQEHKDAIEFYPNATIAELLKAFDFDYAITQSDLIEVTEKSISMKLSDVPAVLETVWDYEWNGALAIA